MKQDIESEKQVYKKQPNVKTSGEQVNGQANCLFKYNLESLGV